jgi:hypothetical protein
VASSGTDAWASKDVYRFPLDTGCCEVDQDLAINLKGLQKRASVIVVRRMAGLFCTAGAGLATGTLITTSNWAGRCVKSSHSFRLEVIAENIDINLAVYRWLRNVEGLSKGIRTWAIWS